MAGADLQDLATTQQGIERFTLISRAGSVLEKLMGLVVSILSAWKGLAWGVAWKATVKATPPVVIVEDTLPNIKATLQNVTTLLEAARGAISSLGRSAEQPESIRGVGQMAWDSADVQCLMVGTIPWLLRLKVRGRVPIALGAVGLAVAVAALVTFERRGHGGSLTLLETLSPLTMIGLTLCGAVSIVEAFRYRAAAQNGGIR